jgi:hypothetical protein
MKKAILICIITLVVFDLSSQEKKSYQTGVTAQQNINAIVKLAPYSDGAVGFDTRYEGVKGSPRLFEKLMPSFLKVKGLDDYVKLESDIDLVGNTLLFNHPQTGKMLTLAADNVIELVFVNSEGEDQVFRTTAGMKFEKDIKETKFCQILSDSPVMFIKMPVKIFTEADYKGAYTADRKYDEYETKLRYYIATEDGVLHQVQLNKNALTKLFPEKKSIIKETAGSRSFENDEEMVKAVLGKF